MKDRRFRMKPTIQAHPKITRYRSAVVGHGDHAIPAVEHPGLPRLFLRKPVSRYRLQLREEAHAVRAHRVQDPEKRVLMIGKPEHAQRDRDTDVHTDHAPVRLAGKLAGVKISLGVNHRAVAKLVGVHQSQAFLEILDAFDTQHRTEDLLVPHRHIQLHVIEYGRPHVKALFIALDRHPAAVQDKFGALFDPFWIQSVTK